MLRILETSFFIFCLCFLPGCFFTKIATTPVRIVGAATSVVPIVGNPTDDAIDSLADSVDKIPI